MRWMIVLPSLIGLTAAGTVQAELSVGLTEGLTLTHDSVVRTYDVMRPEGIGGATSAPLVVDLHGFGSNSAQQRGISGFFGLSALEGFVVAWPNGFDSSWNGITCCGTGVSANVDDVGFIRAMVADIVLEVNIDIRRIYVTGLSNGGAMSHRLACEAADLFAAAAPMAYPIPYPDFSAQCNPSRLIPVLTFMGLTDTVVSYAGAAPTLVGWRDKDGCDSGGAVVEINEIYGGSDCAIDTSCAEPDLEIGLCSVTGISFAPPLDNLDGHILYFNEDDFDITERAWDFMSRYQTPPPPPIPLFGAPILLVGLVASGAAMLYRHRRKNRGLRHHGPLPSSWIHLS